MLVIDGLEIELYYTMDVWCEIEETVGMLNELDSILKGPKRLRALMGLIAAMSRGKVTREWLMEHMNIKDYSRAMQATSECIKRAFTMQNAEKKTESGT